VQTGQRGKPGTARNVAPLLAGGRLIESAHPMPADHGFLGSRPFSRAIARRW
jgi:hypothetical protein